MKDNYVILTGGHTGIGLGVTKKLLDSGCKIGLIIRSEQRKNQTISDLGDLTQAQVDNIDFFYADLSDQSQVTKVAAEINAKWPRIDRLFNNAGVVGGPNKGRNTSKQGNEWHYEINALSHYILTRDLRPLLEKSDEPRVITTVTEKMHSRKLRTDLIFNSKYSSTMGLYAQSKTAVMLMLNDFAQEWQGVKFVFLNPGPNKTNMTQSGNTPWIIRKLFSGMFKDPSVGSGRLYNAGFKKDLPSSKSVFIDGEAAKDIMVVLSQKERERLHSGLQV